jgi:hypothetical protein
MNVASFTNIYIYMHVIYTRVQLQITQVTMFVKCLLNAPPISRIKQSFQTSEIMRLSSQEWVIYMRVKRQMLYCLYRYQYTKKI